MNFKRHWNERTRLMLTLELAVVLPAALLVFLGVWHLKSIQRDRGVEAAFQRDFNQVLLISEKQMNARAYELLDEVHAEFPAASAACAPTLDRILAKYPSVAYVFVYDSKPGLIFRSRRMDEQARADTAYLQPMYNTWMQASYKDYAKELAEAEKKGRRPTTMDWLPRGDKHAYVTGQAFLTGDSWGGKTAIGGIILDPDFLQNQFLPGALDAILSQQEEKGEKNHVVMMIRGRYDYSPMLASAGWDGGKPEVERNLEGAFPGLVLGIKMRGTTLAAMQEHFLRTSFLILGAISLLLAGGIILTHRNISREMALARMKSDFVSNVSHELRTPLSLIRLYAETLEMGRVKSAEKYQEYYGIIRKESERLTALINNILDFSRIEAGRKEYDFRETDLGELVHTTLDSYRYQIEQQGFAFDEKIAEDVPPVRVDREAISRSLLNLVNNALKYSQDRKFISVNLFRDNGSVKLEVVDEGIGIPQHEQTKIFEKFYRVGDPLVHNTKGSGLGLSLVQHIAQAHGGDVSVESAPGRGSRFTIRIPLAPLANGTKVGTA